MNLQVRHEIVGAPGGARGLRIAQVSDLHLWFSARKLCAVEDVIAKWEPEVLALTGGYADTPTGRRLAAAWMGRMAAAYPLCWVAGNHDRCGGGRFLAELETLPRAHAIDREDAWIAGAGGRRYRFTSWERMARTAEAKGTDDSEASSVPSVVLLHDPAQIEVAVLRGSTKCVVLAGHLHGGQINLWRDRQGRPWPAAWCYRWLAQRTNMGAATVIVSGGLGDTLPLRIGAPREVVIVDLLT